MGEEKGIFFQIEGDFANRGGGKEGYGFWVEWVRNIIYAFCVIVTQMAVCYGVGLVKGNPPPFFLFPFCLSRFFVFPSTPFLGFLSLSPFTVLHPSP